MVKKVTLLSIALLAMAQAAQAQAGHQHGQPGAMQRPMMQQGCMGMGMGMGMGHGAGMMANGVPQVGAVLRAAEPLALTATQKTQLEAIQTRLQQTVAPQMEQLMAAHHKMSEIMQANQPDLNAYESTMKEAAGHMTAMHLAVVRAGLEARALLTPEQRNTLSKTTAMMHSMMCGQGGMMQHGRGGN
jgi:Spy/CpxP family protein refolding chaperone